MQNFKYTAEQNQYIQFLREEVEKHDWQILINKGIEMGFSTSEIILIAQETYAANKCNETYKHLLTKKRDDRIKNMARKICVNDPHRNIRSEDIKLRLRRKLEMRK